MRREPCVVCFRPASREVRDEYGERLPLCARCPTPVEIALRTAEVRRRWNVSDYWMRSRRIPRITFTSAATGASIFG
jgi:hypothetical protein